MDKVSFISNLNNPLWHENGIDTRREGAEIDPAMNAVDAAKNANANCGDRTGCECERLVGVGSAPLLHRAAKNRSNGVKSLTPRAANLQSPIMITQSHPNFPQVVPVVMIDSGGVYTSISKSKHGCGIGAAAAVNLLQNADTLQALREVFNGTQNNCVQKKIDLRSVEAPQSLDGSNGCAKVVQTPVIPANVQVSKTSVNAQMPMTPANAQISKTSANMQMPRTVFIDVADLGKTKTIGWSAVRNCRHILTQSPLRNASTSEHVNVPPSAIYNSISCGSSAVQSAPLPWNRSTILPPSSNLYSAYMQQPNATVHNSYKSYTYGDSVLPSNVKIYNSFAE
jgi:hypothetical protein